jgi:hypothetical protein
MFRSIQLILQRFRNHCSQRRNTNPTNTASLSPSDANNGNAKGLLDLPPEVRQIIYEYVMPHEIDIRLMQQSRSFLMPYIQSKRNIIIDTTTEWDSCAGCEHTKKLAAALMQTYKTLRDEFGRHFYSNIELDFADLYPMAEFLNRLSLQFQTLIKWVTI